MNKTQSTIIALLEAAGYNDAAEYVGDEYVSSKLNHIVEPNKMVTDTECAEALEDIREAITDYQEMEDRAGNYEDGYEKVLIGLSTATGKEAVSKNLATLEKSLTRPQIDLESLRKEHVYPEYGMACSETAIENDKRRGYNQALDDTKKLMEASDGIN